VAPVVRVVKDQLVRVARDLLLQPSAATTTTTTTSTTGTTATATALPMSAVSAGDFLHLSRQLAALYPASFESALVLAYRHPGRTGFHPPLSLALLAGCPPDQDDAGVGAQDTHTGTGTGAQGPVGVDPRRRRLCAAVRKATRVVILAVWRIATGRFLVHACMWKASCFVVSCLLCTTYLIYVYQYLLC
jgi:hypothetical protein